MSYSLHFQDSSSNAVPSEVKEFDAASGAFDQAFVTTGSGTLDAPFDLAFKPASPPPPPVPALAPGSRALVAAMLALLGADRMHRTPFARAGGAR